MEIKRVLVIAITNLELNGITSVIMNCYRNIDRSKIQFDFAVGEKISDKIKFEIEKLGGKVYQLPSRKKKTLEYMKALKALIKEKKYQIIHGHGNSGTLYLDINIAKRAGAKVRIAHSHNSECDYKLVHKLLKEKLNKELTDAVACSELAGNWLFTKPFVVVNNGIELDNFKFNEDVRNEVRSDLNLDGKFVIGHIGRFSEVKNHKYIIDILKELSKIEEDIMLLLVGDGELKSSIEEKVNELGLSENVMFLGKRTDTNKLIQGMDAFVFPSLHEGLPVSLVEIQASGLKAVIADTITKECDITNRITYLNINENPKVWAEELLKLKNSYRRDNVLNIMENSKFNIKKEVKKLEEIYLKY